MARGLSGYQKIYRYSLAPECLQLILQGVNIQAHFLRGPFSPPLSSVFQVSSGDLYQRRVSGTNEVNRPELGICDRYYSSMNVARSVILKTCVK